MDKQVTAVVNRAPVIPLCVQSWVYDDETRNVWGVSDGAHQPFVLSAPVLKQVHPFVLLVLSAMLDKKWTPVAAQVPVMHEECGIASAADILCTDANGNWILVEVKCKRKERFNDVSPYPMHGPFEHVPNTPCNRDKVQAAFTRSMLVRTCPVTEGCAAVVARVHRDGVEFFDVEESFSGMVDALWKSMGG